MNIQLEKSQAAVKFHSMFTWDTLWFTLGCKQTKTRSTRTTETQHSKIPCNSKPPTDIEHFYSFNHQKFIPYQILGGKTVKDDQTDPQITEIWTQKLNVP